MVKLREMENILPFQVMPNFYVKTIYLEIVASNETCIFFMLGKMSSDNSPAVCVWNVRRGTHKFLVPPQPFCPFRK